MAQIVYARVNQILEDEITALGTDAARTPVTGLSGFTLALSRGTTSGLSTAGVTVTEVGLGKYDVTVTAATLATTGTYTLRITNTSGGNAYVWEQIYVVTSDGTPSGTSGVASFTATANSGRITDGTNPISGATIYLRDPSNNLYVQTTSDVNGLWGPVWFTTAGNYPVYSQKSGYAQGSATITVSGAATSIAPTTDITMATISSSSGLLTSDLIAYARRMAFDKTGSKADTELLQSVNMALDQVAKSHIWPRYVTRGQISFNGAYSTGTVTMTVGSANVTLAGGTWPTWASGAKIVIGGQVYGITSRTSASIIVIEAPWVDSTNLTSTFTIFQDAYSLPNDMYKFGRLVPGQRWPYGGDPVGPEVLIERQMVVPFGQRAPNIWAFVNQTIVIYPWPSQDILCGYWYYRRPTNLVNSTDLADWDPSHIELLRRAIDYQVAVLYGSYSGGTPEQAMQRYEEALGRAVPNDRTTITTPSIMGSPLMSGQVPLWSRRTS